MNRRPIRPGCHFLRPTVLHSILGGGVLVALLFLRQVPADKRDRRTEGRHDLP